MFIDRIVTNNLECHEADIVVTDGEFSLLCCVYNYEKLDIDMPITSLVGLGCSHIMIIGKDINDLERIKKLEGYYAYTLCAEIVSIKQRMVKLGKLYIQLDSDFPGDSNVGDSVEFELLRLDALF